MNIVSKTARIYGNLWIKDKYASRPDRWHFNAMQEVITEPIVRGKRGIDIGSGCGYDTYIMAKQYPEVNIVSIDISDGIYMTRRLANELNNVNAVKSSVLQIPAKNNIFDFAYSFGVLHHIPDPSKWLLEISRILKKEAPVFLYLYEDHSRSFIKQLAVKLVNRIRRVTTKIPPKILYFLSWAASPFIFAIFSLPAKMLKRFKITENIAQKIPFNFGTSFFSLQDDLYDRFSAPIEHRYNEKEMLSILTKCGFYKINITKLNNASGWVAWGYKK